MLCELPTVTVLWVRNVRLVLSSSYFQILCLPYVELPAFSTDQHIDNVFSVAIKEPMVFPTEFLFPTKFETKAWFNVTMSMVFATLSAVEKSG